MPEREVQQQHRVEERGVAREGREVDRVGRDQSERDEQQAVEAPLPGLQDAGGPGGRKVLRGHDRRILVRGRGSSNSAIVAAMRAVFADCHVGRRPGDEGPFLEALAAAQERGARAITLLGDIFHFFIAHPKFETPAIARFLDAARRLKQAGVAVTYVEGNRDFFLRGSYAESAFGSVCDEETLRGRRPAVPRDARRPAERAGPAVPLLAVPVEEPGLPRGARLRAEGRWPTGSSGRSRRGSTSPTSSTRRGCRSR